MEDFNTRVVQNKNKLEITTLENPEIDVTMFITEIKQGLKNEQSWKKEMDHFESGVALLKKEKFQFPIEQKLNIDNVKGAWNNFK